MTARKRKQNHNSERLVGWLVSYEDDEMGDSFEIRAGRTLVSSDENGQERCLLLDSTDLSAPHSALRASAAHRVMIQDIFSQQGTFLTRGGSRNEEKISGPTEVKHGDWLRFGQKVRYQVCLVDAPAK